MRWFIFGILFCYVQFIFWEIYPIAKVSLGTLRSFFDDPILKCDVLILKQAWDLKKIIKIHQLFMKKFTRNFQW